jgi:hypothetical protein
MDGVFVPMLLPTINSRNEIEFWVCVQTQQAKTETFNKFEKRSFFLAAHWRIYLKLATITDIINFTIVNDKEWEESFSGKWL